MLHYILELVVELFVAVVAFVEVAEQSIPLSKHYRFLLVDGNHLRIHHKIFDHSDMFELVPVS
jgi:hypothetical protein